MKQNRLSHNNLVRFVLFLALISSLTIVCAQEYQYVPFPKSGVLWSEIYYVHNETSEEKTCYECFALNGEDTLINGLAYSKVYHFFDSVFDENQAVCIGGIREDSLKRVYYAGEVIHSLKPSKIHSQPDGEIILFDFGVEIGDTIDYPINSDVPEYGIYFVNKIDTIMLGGTLRRQIHFKNYDDDIWGFTWIEGLGSTRGLLFVSGTIPYSRNNHLICFFQNDEMIYHFPVYPDCFPGYVGIDQRELNAQIIVAPNPVKNKEVRIDLNTSEFEKIQFFSPKGMLLATYPVESSKTITISLPQLDAGVYYYKAYTKSGRFTTGRFLLKE